MRNALAEVCALGALLFCVITQALSNHWENYPNFNTVKMCFHILVFFFWLLLYVVNDSSLNFFVVIIKHRK